MFDTKDNDRVRGCYNYHLIAMRDVKRDLVASMGGRRRGGIEVGIKFWDLSSSPFGAEMPLGRRTRESTPRTCTMRTTL